MTFNGCDGEQLSLCEDKSHEINVEFLYSWRTTLAIVFLHYNLLPSH